MTNGSLPHRASPPMDVCHARALGVPSGAATGCLCAVTIIFVAVTRPPASRSCGRLRSSAGRHLERSLLRARCGHG